MCRMKKAAGRWKAPMSLQQTAEVYGAGGRCRGAGGGSVCDGRPGGVDGDRS